MRQIDIVVAGEGRTRKVPHDATCPLCTRDFESDDVVMRILDLTDAPVRQTNMHKTCVRLLLEATIDDTETEPGCLPFRAMLVPHLN